MRAFDQQNGFNDAEEIEHLRSAVIDGLKSFEFTLRRELDGNNEKLLLGSGGEVPAEFKKLVEEYYRSLSGGRQP